ncbi:hypothetical protein SAMN05443247_09016 [Bradyrhizobium erythrophlei]|jgi:hypothetical protein|nr:hypothetical protein SAMN05443247_09016 [Bradyrhizobium erythrophlei]
MALKVPPPPAERFRLHRIEPGRASMFRFALLTVSCAVEIVRLIDRFGLGRAVST